MAGVNQFTEGKALKSIIRFALPIMLSSLLQYNYIIVDNIIVGRYVSTDALAAVGSVGAINSFIIGAALGLTSGFTIPVAHAFGADDRKKSAHFAGNSVTLAFIIGVALVVIAHVISTPLLRLINTPENIIDLSAAYINILYYAIPFQMLSNNFTAISRAIGDSKRPLYYFLVSVAVNLVLDIVFVKELGLGVEGAALATLISHSVAAILTGIYVLRLCDKIKITKRDFIPNKQTINKQLRLGVPVSLQFTITSIGSMCLQGAVNSFGSNVVAGFTAAGRIENLANIPLSGLGVATQTFVGQNYGAKKYQRITKTVAKVFALDILLSLIMSAILIGLAPYAVSIFMTEQNSEIMFAAKCYLQAVGMCFSLVAALFVLRNTLQGLGFTYANTIAGAGELVGRILVALVFSRLIGFEAVCFAAPAAWLFADIPLAIIYLKKRKELIKKS